MANKSIGEAFRDLHSKIVDGVNPDSIMDELFSKMVISKDEFNRLRYVPVPRDRCRDMLLLLHNSSHPQMFIHLRLALLDEYPWIVDEIDRKLTSPTCSLRQLYLGTSSGGK